MRVDKEKKEEKQSWSEGSPMQVITYWLRYVAQTSFHRGDESHAEIFKRQLSSLKQREVILLFSASYKQFRLLCKPGHYKDGLNQSNLRRMGVHKVLISQNFRVTEGGTWAPPMIKELLLREGIKLEGIELISKHFAWDTNEGRN